MVNVVVVVQWLLWIKVSAKSQIFTVVAFLGHFVLLTYIHRSNSGDISTSPTYMHISTHTHTHTPTYMHISMQMLCYCFCIVGNQAVNNKQNKAKNGQDSAKI